MLVVSLGVIIVEGSINAGEGGSGSRVNIHADDVDVIGAGPPASHGLAGGIVVGAPEHQDLGVAGNSSMDGLPCRDKFGLRCSDG